MNDVPLPEPEPPSGSSLQPSLESPPEPVACRSCSALLRGGTRFCGNCGRDVGAAPAPSRPRDPLAAWRKFKPLLQLWIALLALNLALGLMVTALDGDAEAALIGEAAATLLSLLVVAIAASRERDALRPLLRSHGFVGRNALVAPAALLAIGLFMTSWIWLCRRLHLPVLETLDHHREAGWPLWTAFVSIAVLPPIYEEVAFRGVIQEGLARVMRPIDALLVQAALFSVLHLSPMTYVSHFGMGLVLGVTRTRTGSLYPPMVVHAAWNAWVLVREMQGAG